MMDKITTVIRLLIWILCAVLFLAGALWNLCVQPEAATETIADTEIQQDTPQYEQQTIENRLAALRIERDTAWQQLQHAVEVLEFAEKQQTLQQYAKLQYNEQKIELLLKAKGIADCLAVLGEEQANIIVPAEILQQEYEKLFDLVLRNTDYDETQIILVPMK